MFRVLLLSLVTLSVVHAQGDLGVRSGLVAATVDPNLATVSGTFTDATGAPVEDVIIRITAVSPRNTAAPMQDSAPAPYSAISDVAGMFRIEGVTPGIYSSIIYHAKYTLVPGTGPLSNQIPSLTLAAGDRKSGYSFVMRAKPTIKGRVTDQDGKPVGDIEVSLVSGAPGYRVADSADVEVDEEGNYSISNVQEGQGYYLRFGPRRQYIDPADLPDISDDVEPGLVETYYPGVEQLSAATEIRMTGGRDLTGLDLRLRKAPRYRIRARLEHAEDVADDSVIAFLVPLDSDDILPPSVAMTNGEVEFMGVAAGRYMIQTDPFAFKNDESRERLFVGQETVTVGKRNVDGVKIQANQVAYITVKKVYDPTSNAPPKGQEARYTGIGLRSTTTPWLPPKASATKDGVTILQDVVPGDYILTANLGEAMKSARFGGQEVVGGLLRVAPGAVGVLEVRMSFNVTQVTGVVRDAQGRPVPNAYVGFRSTGTGSRNEFVVANAQAEFAASIAPGRYKVMAWSREDFNVGITSEIDAKRLENQEIVLETGERGGTKTLNLVIEKP